MLKIIASSSSSSDSLYHYRYGGDQIIKLGYILDNNGNKLEQFREKKTGN